MTSDVSVARVEPTLLAVVRRCAHGGELARVVPAACGAVWTALRDAGIAAGRHVAVYLDDTINLEVGVEVDRPFSSRGEVIPSATPAGLVAHVTHYGPYRDLHAAHAAIKGWCRQHGHHLAGPRWETYGHWEAAWAQAPDRIRTDVAYLIAEQPPRHS